MNAIKITSKFNPFSYEDLAAPLQEATKSHIEYENALGEIAANANDIGGLINQEQDPELYAQYNNYYNGVKSVVDDLAANGLSPNIRSQLLDYKTRYGTEIKPIFTAFIQRNALASAQRDALLKDSTMLFEKDAGTIPLIDFVKNPELSIRSYSGQTLFAESAQTAKNLAESLRQYPEKWEPILHGTYYEQMLKSGYTEEEIIRTILQDPGAPAALKNVFNNVITASGIDTWGNEQALEQAQKYVGNGLYSAIGKPTITRLANPYSRISASGSGRGGRGGGRGGNSQKETGYTPYTVIGISKNNPFAEDGPTGKKTFLHDLERLDTISREAADVYEHPENYTHPNMIIFPHWHESDTRKANGIAKELGLDMDFTDMKYDERIEQINKMQEMVNGWTSLEENGITLQNNIYKFNYANAAPILKEIGLRVNNLTKDDASRRRQGKSAKELVHYRGSGATRNKAYTDTVSEALAEADYLGVDVGTGMLVVGNSHNKNKLYIDADIFNDPVNDMGESLGGIYKQHYSNFIQAQKDAIRSGQPLENIMMIQEKATEDFLNYLMYGSIERGIIDEGLLGYLYRNSSYLGVPGTPQTMSNMREIPE